MLNIAASVFRPASSDRLACRPRVSSRDAACFAPGAPALPPPRGEVMGGVSGQASASANPGTSCDSHSEWTDTRSRNSRAPRRCRSCSGSRNWRCASRVWKSWRWSGLRPSTARPSAPSSILVGCVLREHGVVRDRSDTRGDQGGGELPAEGAIDEERRLRRLRTGGLLRFLPTCDRNPRLARRPNLQLSTARG